MAFEPLGAGIGPEQRQVIGPRDVRLPVIVEQVGHRHQCLRGGVGPRVAAPPAAVVRHIKQRVAPLGGGGPERRGEVAGVRQEAPGRFVAGIRQLELPGHEPDLLPAVRVAGVRSGLIGERSGGNAVLLVMGELMKEELARRIPELALNPILQLGGALGELGGGGGVPQQRRRLRDGPLVRPQIAVERRPVALRAGEFVGGLPAVDVELHAVMHAVPPEHLVGRVPMLRHPSVVLLQHVRKHRAHEAGIAGDAIRRPERVGVPVAVAPRLRTGRLEPVVGEVIDDPPVAEPAHFVELVSQRAADRTIGARPERPVDEFAEGVAGGGGTVGQMLGDQLPAVIVRRIDGAVGRVEEGDLRLVPVPVAVVPPVLLGQEGVVVEDLGREGCRQ